MNLEEKQSKVFQCCSEPNVISHDLLHKLVINQGPEGEAGKLFHEDGIKLEEVEEIRIEFLNILHISHLWMMSNLVKLKLSSNIIEKIENLEELVNLKELDLSFNRISIIENLNHLLNLEILLIYKNEIETVEGMDNLAKLQILSFGKNSIKTQDHVMYLRKFQSLRSLNMEGNPCTEKEGYVDYLISYVPQLVYLQYKMITNDQRNCATEKYYQDISNLEEKEAKKKELIDEKNAVEDHNAQVSISYVEYFDEDHLFEQMYEHDKEIEGRALKDLTEDTEAAYERYKITFSAICHRLFELGLKEQLHRMEEIRLFEDTVKKGKDEVQKKAQVLIDAMLKRKAEILLQVSSLLESVVEEQEMQELEEKMSKAKVLSEELSNIMTKTWTELMEREVILHDQLEDLNEVFKNNILDLVGSFLEAAREAFAQMRDAEGEYKATLFEIVTIFMNSFGEEANILIDLQELCGSKYVLGNNIAASHDKHLQVIDGREDRIVSRLKIFLEDLIEGKIQEEKRRSRNQILEISHFMDYQREEFNKLKLRHEAKMIEEDDNNDDSITIITV